MTPGAQAPRVLVTGVNGFVGVHLARELAGHGFEVVGLGVGERAPHLGNEVTSYLQHDLTSSWPDIPGITHIVHLAALSAVGPSFHDPQKYVHVNSSMIVNLGQFQLATAQRARALVVSSGAVYEPQQPLPIAEDGGIRLNSPYAVSKVLVENFASYYVGLGLDWVVVRPFNHIGPGQGPGFLLPDLARQLLTARGSGRPLWVGDLGTARDYTDVRDVARAYRLLLEAEPGDQRVFNVCSGRSRTGRELLDLLVAHFGLADVEICIDPARLRPDDPRLISGTAARLRALTGWEPRLSVESCIADFVESFGDGIAV